MPLLWGNVLFMKGCVLMARKTRSDCTVGTFEKKHGLPPGTIRNKDGRDTRSDKKIGTIRDEYQKQAKSKNSKSE